MTQFHVEKTAKGKGYTKRKLHRTVAFELKQVYNFEHKETVTKAKPWLKPAWEEVAEKCQAIFNAQMKKLGM